MLSATLAAHEDHGLLGGTHLRRANHNFPPERFAIKASRIRVERRRPEHSAAAYPHDLADHIADTAIGCTSTAAIELAAAAAVSAVLRDASRFSSLTLFIDNEAARGAINLGSSRVPSLRPLLRALFQPSEQILAVRVSTTANSFADRLSRGDSAAVLRDAAALGWPQTFHGSDGVDWQPLRSAVERRTL